MWSSVGENVFDRVLCHYVIHLILVEKRAFATEVSKGNHSLLPVPASGDSNAPEDCTAAFESSPVRERSLNDIAVEVCLAGKEVREDDRVPRIRQVVIYYAVPVGNRNRWVDHSKGDFESATTAMILCRHMGTHSSLITFLGILYAKAENRVLSERRSRRQPENIFYEAAFSVDNCIIINFLNGTWAALLRYA